MMMRFIDLVMGRGERNYPKNSADTHACAWSQMHERVIQKHNTTSSEVAYRLRLGSEISRSVPMHMLLLEEESLACKFYQGREARSAEASESGGFRLRRSKLSIGKTKVPNEVERQTEHPIRERHKVL